MAVIENEADIPTEGKFVMKGRIPTDKDNNWAIHASTFEHNGQRYMIWCGWQKRSNKLKLPQIRKFTKQFV